MDNNDNFNIKSSNSHKDFNKNNNMFDNIEQSDDNLNIDNDNIKF